MKVLIVNDYGCLSGGAERLSMVLRDGLRERGHDARLFTSSAEPVAAENPADYTCFGTESVAQLLLQIANPMAVLALRRVLERFQPDVVHVRMFMSQLSPLVLPALRGYRCVLHLGGYQTACPINTRILPDGTDCMVVPGRACHSAGCVTLPGLARTALQFGAWRRWRSVFARIIANSSGLASRLAHGGVIADGVIWSGTPVRPPRPPLADPPTVAFAGRLVDRKGILVLIRAMRLVVDRVPRAKLIVAGGGPHQGSVTELVSQLGLEPAVAMLGYLSPDQAAEETSPAWVTAVPTIVHEAFSNTAIESMMRGTAVIASDVGGFPEMIEPGVSGLLVARGDVEGLAAALTTCLLDRQLSEAMGANARKRALEEFTVDAMVDRFLGVYRELSPKSSSKPERILSVIPHTT